MSTDLNTALDEAITSVFAQNPDHSAKPADDDAPPATDELEPPAVEGEDGDAGDDAPPEPALPEGYVAPANITDTLVTQFTIYDGEGELEVPDLMIKYQANGKERNDRIDQVVKLAQWGVYNQERDQRAKLVEQQYNEVEGERTALQELLQEREAQLERILQDDEFLLAAREAYERENSPDRRAERAEERAREAQAQAELAPIAAEGQRFYRGEVSPALARITEVLPTITLGELDKRMAQELQAHAVVGPHGQLIVTPDKYNAIRQYIVEDLAVWAKAMHEYRTTGKVGAVTVPTAQPPESTELTRARREAQKAKNTIARAIKPAGGGAPTKESRGKSAAAKPSTVDEALASAMDSVLSSIPR